MISVGEYDVIRKAPSKMTRALKSVAWGSSSPGLPPVSSPRLLLFEDLISCPKESLSFELNTTNDPEEEAPSLAGSAALPGVGTPPNAPDRA